MSPLVSVVIPTYNHAHFLGRALQSVLDQTYSSWEAIVVDNHSQDNTDEVVAKFEDPRIALLKIHNGGIIAASRNAGIRAAKGEWIAFLDSDDWWTPNKLQACFEYAKDKANLIYHKLKIIRKSPALLRPSTIDSWQVRTPVIIDLLVNSSSPIGNSSVVVRKSLLDQIGGLVESDEMVGCEDYNAWLRIAQITDAFVYVPEILGAYTDHDAGISRKDMSGPIRCAVAPFMFLLNEQQKVIFDSMVNYASGRFAFVNGDHLGARKKLLFCLRHGDFLVKLKSAIMLISGGMSGARAKNN